MAKKQEILKAEDYWNKYMKEELAFARFSPFFVGVAAGNLEMQSFHRCISQDLYFLQAFFQVYEMAEEWVEKDEAKRKLICDLRSSVHNMIQTYETTVVQKWNIELPKVTGPDSTMHKYWKLLITTACGKVEGKRVVQRIRHGKVAAYILAAIAPYMRLYSYLGRTTHSLLLNLDPNITSHHVYKRWLEYYSSQDHQNLVKDTEDALDKLSVSLNAKERREAEWFYHQSMKLQVEFFASQTVPQPTAVPLYRVQDLNDNPHQLTIYPDFDLISSVEIPQERNKEEFKQFLQTIMRGDPGKVFDYDGLKKAVGLVEEFEEKANANANAMVVESRELTDLKLKDCCREFFQKKIAEKKNPRIEVRVITSNWRVGLIKSAFSSGQGHVKIRSNNSVYEAVLKRDNSGSSEGQHLIVCIGSGVGDLLCLVEADIGIVFGSDKDLRELGKKFGVSFVSLFLGTVTNQMGLDDWKWRPRSGKLYKVHSWGEIQAFIVGYK